LSASGVHVQVVLGSENNFVLFLVVLILHDPVLLDEGELVALQLLLLLHPLAVGDVKHLEQEPLVLLKRAETVLVFFDLALDVDDLLLLALQLDVEGLPLLLLLVGLLDFILSLLFVLFDVTHQLGVILIKLGLGLLQRRGFHVTRFNK
jgi:hypothetical protein